MIDPPLPHFQPPANDAGGPAEDIRERLRADHDAALAALDALRRETDSVRCMARLRELRTAWVVHALAEETVVYRMLEGASDGGARADERFIEHELVGGLFDKLGGARPGTLEWNARLNVIRDLISRHIESEYRTLYPQLAQRLDDQGRADMGERFELARQKLLMLERAKAA